MTIRYMSMAKCIETEHLERSSHDQEQLVPFCLSQASISTNDGLVFWGTYESVARPRWVNERGCKDNRVFEYDLLC